MYSLHQFNTWLLSVQANFGKFYSGPVFWWPLSVYDKFVHIRGWVHKVGFTVKEICFAYFAIKHCV